MSDAITCTAVGGEQLVASRFGGQVLSWRDRAGRELLYLSPLASPGAPIRGGVPVCFPQFAARGPLAKHGFARVLPWTVVDQGERHVHLRLDRPADGWPHRYQLDLSATLEPGVLEVRLQVRNLDAHRWAFTGALHTYLRVEDVRRVTLAGLEGCEYEDALANGAVGRAEGAPDLSRPIDRVYRDVPGPLHLEGAQHDLRISQSGFTDVVVWNPGEEGRPGDLPQDDVRRMLCVEAAAVARPIELAPGASWSGSQRLELLGRSAARTGHFAH